MRHLRAPAKINLALVVGPLAEGGKHEVATVLQRVALADEIALAAGDRLTVSGFDGDTIVAGALAALAAAAGVEPAWHVEIAKSIPVAAGLGGGSSDAASALRLANELLPEPLAPHGLAALAATIGADVPFFLADGPQLGTGDGSVLEPLDLPQGFWVVLVVPSGAVKASTRDVYAAFDAREGAVGFEARRTELLEALAAVRRPLDLAAAAAERPRVLAARGETARGRRIPGRRQRGRPVRVRPVRRSRRGRRGGSQPSTGGADVGHGAGVVGVIAAP